MHVVADIYWHLPGHNDILPWPKTGRLWHSVLPETVGLASYLYQNMAKTEHVIPFHPL